MYCLRGQIYYKVNYPNVRLQDHVVLLLGCGINKATGRQFFLIKNSWGIGWSNQGYGLIDEDAFLEMWIPRDAEMVNN